MDRLHAQPFQMENELTIRLTQIDGKLPNLALMKLAAHYRVRGYELRLTKSVVRELDEPQYEHVFGSAIFSFSRPRVEQLKLEFPNAIVGGTYDTTDNRTVEEFLGVGGDLEVYDYSIYPNFDASMGFTQRGCRLKCGFCVVPKKEGRPRSVNTIYSIWRGEGHPKHIHLLDNDFFGQPPDQWRARIDEIRSGGFRVCLNQGINIRMIDDEAARNLASIQYYDDSFKTRRLYTAWDNIGDEERFFRGCDTLEKHGIPAKHIMAYMLVGYDKRETWERVLYRFNKMVQRGVNPYPMIYGDRNRTLPLGGCNQRLEKRTLGEFQRWVIRRLYQFLPFEFYDTRLRVASSETADLFDEGRAA